MDKPKMPRRQMLSLAGATAGLATLPARAAGARERIRITRVDLYRVVVPMQPDIINSREFSPDALSEFPKAPNSF